MLWKKPAEMRYTEMCMYIDSNIPKIAEEGKYPLIENTVYNYLWLLVKALAIKKHLFQKFEDYDGYAFEAASRLFFALRRNYQNQGKTIKGRKIRPIKSSLNYTKALLYPMKVEYQRRAYNEVISEEFANKKFDAFSYKQQLKAMAETGQNVSYIIDGYIKDTILNCPKIVDEVLATSPFLPGSSDYKKLKISLLLNCLYSLKTKNQLAYDLDTIFLWKLPKSMAGYVKVLIKEFYTKLKTELVECFKVASISDDMLEKLISFNSEGEYINHEE